MYSIAQDRPTYAIQHEIKRAKGLIVERDDGFVGAQPPGFLLALRAAHLCRNVSSGCVRELYRELPYAASRSRYENPTA